MTRLRAGAGRARIALDGGVLPVDGFGAVAHPLDVRVLLLDDGPSRVAVGALELTSLPDWAVQRFRTVVSAATGAPERNVLVAVSHTFSAPHLPTGPPRDAAGAALLDAVEDAVRRAAGAAAAGVVPARARFGRGRCRVGVCRDVLTPRGWWLGADDSGPTDDDLPVLCLDGPGGGPLAMLACYGVQASVLDGSRDGDGRRAVSSDLFGAASRHVERRHGDAAVVVLLPAAAGDQAPTLTAVRTAVGPDGGVRRVDAGLAGHVLVDLLGERLGEQVLRTAAAARPVDVDDLGVQRTAVRVAAQVPPRRREDLAPTRAHPFTADGETDLPFAVLRVGPLRLVGVRPELNAVSGLELRRLAGDRVLLATLVDGGAKYAADAGSYDRITYPAMNSRFARGCAERLVEAAAAAVRGT